MAWSILKKAINDAIKTNGNQEITGSVLQNILGNIVSSVGENATFLGVLSKSTTNHVPDGPSFYIVKEAGVYSNFSGLTLNEGEFGILSNKGGTSNWTYTRIQEAFATTYGDNRDKAASQKLVTMLRDSVDAKIGNLEDLKTEEKTSLVTALNEILSDGSGAGLPGISSADGTSKTLLFDQNTEDFTAGLLEANGSILNGYNGHTSDFIEVESSDIISVTPSAKNYDYKRPTILGYDSNKNVVGIIAKAIDYSNLNVISGSPLYFEYYQIPAGIKYIRLSSNTASFSFYKVPFNVFIDEITNRKSEDSGIFSPYDTSIWTAGYGGARLNGEKFIPVYEGLTVFCSAIGFQSAKGLGLYDSSKTFIKSLPISYDKVTTGGYLYTYRFTKEDIDSGIVYMRADSFPPIIGATREKAKNNIFFILNDFSSLTNADKIFLKNAFYASNIFRSPSSTGIKMAISAGATKVSDTSFRVNSKSMAVVGYSTASENLPYFGDTAILFAEIEVSELPSNSSLRIAERGLGVYEGLESVSNGVYYIPIFTEIGENQYLHITATNEATPLVTLKRYVTYYCPLSFLDMDSSNNMLVRAISEGTQGVKKIGGWLISNARNILERYYSDNFMSNAISTSRFSKEAGVSLEMETHRSIKGKAYVSFGTSITQGTWGGYTQYIARFFGLRDTNLGISGSVPHGTTGSLRDERLALIPSDTALCTICYGANGWVHTDDIDSRDTTNSIGAINHAIDYLRENNPDCVIVLGLDYGGPFCTQCKDIKAIAERRGIHYAPTEYIDGDLQWDEVSNSYKWARRVDVTSYDGVHLNLLGNTRMASAFINTASKLLTPKGVN